MKYAEEASEMMCQILLEHDSAKKIIEEKSSRDIEKRESELEIPDEYAIKHPTGFNKKEKDIIKFLLSDDMSARKMWDQTDSLFIYHELLARVFLMKSVNPKTVEWISEENTEKIYLLSMALSHYMGMVTGQLYQHSHIITKRNIKIRKTKQKTTVRDNRKIAKRLFDQLPEDVKRSSVNNIVEKMYALNNSPYPSKNTLRSFAKEFNWEPEPIRVEPK